MSVKIIALLKNFNRGWFMLSFAIILFAVVLICFMKIFILKDFLVEFPENCDADSNTCIKVGEDLTPTRFILLKESYLLQNCSDQYFEACLKKCEGDGVCTLETDTSS